MPTMVLPSARLLFLLFNLSLTTIPPKTTHGFFQQQRIPVFNAIVVPQFQKLTAAPGIMSPTLSSLSPPSSSGRPRRACTQRQSLSAAVTPSPSTKNRQDDQPGGRNAPKSRSTSRRVLSMDDEDMKTHDPPLLSSPPSASSTAAESKPKKQPKQTKETKDTKEEESSNTLILTSELLSTINADQPFIDLKIPPEELRPSSTLTTGQCFHWKAVQKNQNVTDQNERQKEEGGSSQPSATSAWGTHDAQEWIGTVRLAPPYEDQSVVIVIRETPTTTLYRPLTDVDDMKVLHDFLRHHYFQISKQDQHDGDNLSLEITLQDLYVEWSEACPRMNVIAKCLPGVRVLQQDPWECLLSFICSSNNNIPRITKMVDSLRKEYGKPLLTLRLSQQGELPQRHSSSSSSSTMVASTMTFYSFPSLQDMMSAGVTEDDLRTKCGMGYRAKYILGTMQLLHEKGGEEYLHNSLNVDDDDYDGDDRKKMNDSSVNINYRRSMALQKKLCEFPGVGRKVADCVALFSLRGESCIPVDTHVWNIARRDYATTKESGDTKNSDDSDSDRMTVLESTVKSITPSVYDAVGSLFRRRFPNKAGWAHSLLFVAELPSFRSVLPSHLVKEMDDFRNEEQMRKKGQKEQKEQQQQKKRKQEDDLLHTTTSAKAKTKTMTKKSKPKAKK